MQQQPQQSDMSTLSYRLTSLETHVQQLQVELRTYVPARENELQLQSIRSTVERIERDVQEAKTQVTSLNGKLETQVKEQDKMQISALSKTLIIILGVFASVLTGVLVYFLTHPGG
jgi:hypothetical protein